MQRIQHLFDAEGLVKDKTQAVLAGADQRMGRVIAVAGHEDHAGVRLGQAECAVDIEERDAWPDCPRAVRALDSGR